MKKISKLNFGLFWFDFDFCLLSRRNTHVPVLATLLMLANWAKLQPCRGQLYLQRWRAGTWSIHTAKLLLSLSMKTHFFTRVLFWKLTYCGDCEPYLETHSKGQLNSEWINEIIVSSKNTEISGSWMSYMSAIKVNPQNSNGFLENVVFVYSMTNCIKSKCMYDSKFISTRAAMK